MLRLRRSTLAAGPAFAGLPGAGLGAATEFFPAKIQYSIFVAPVQQYNRKSIASESVLIFNRTQYTVGRDSASVKLLMHADLTTRCFPISSNTVQNITVYITVKVQYWGADMPF